MADTPRRLATSPMSRRSFLRTAGLTGLLGAGGASLLAACGPDDDAANGTDLSMFIWPGPLGDVPKAQVDAYLAANPIAQVEYIQSTNSVTYPQLVQSVEVNPNNPLVNLGFFNAQVFVLGANDDLWAPYDPVALPHAANVIEKYQVPDRRGVFLNMDALGIVYNKDLVTEPPTSWLQLLDPQYAGQVAVWDAPLFYLNGLAVINQVLGGTEADLGPGFAEYEKAARAGHFLSLYTSVDEQRRVVASGQAALTVAFQGISRPWIEAGDNLGFVAPEEGVMAFPQGFQLVKGSTPEQLAASQELLNMLLEPANIAESCAKSFSIPLVEGVQLPSELASEPTFQLSVVESAIQLNWSDLADLQAEYTSEWNARVKSNI